jgi:hypothetical protein
MDAAYASGTATVAGPVPYSVLDDLLPSGLTFPDASPLLAGYDVDYTSLVLSRMLQLNISYVTTGTYAEMYLSLRQARRRDCACACACALCACVCVWQGLRAWLTRAVCARVCAQGLCDVAVTAAELCAPRRAAQHTHTLLIHATHAHSRAFSFPPLRSPLRSDPSRALCTASCPAVPQGGALALSGDYAADGEWSASTLAKLCCLEYGAPYLNLGFSLASRVKLSSPNVMSALLSPEICNIATVALVMMFIAGFVRAPAVARAMRL